MTSNLGGPGQRVLLASVARRYYVADQSKVEIAAELGLSRFQVARLLDKARATGVVRVEIGQPGDLDLDISSRLQEAFGLRHAVVVATTAGAGAPLRAQLGAAAAALLTEIVTARDVLGVAWARSVSAMATAVSGLAPVPVVQLTGSLTGHDDEDSSVELVRGLARASGGPAFYFYAPMTVADAVTAAALRRQPEVARTFDQFAAVTTAVAGIGFWRAGESTLYDAASPADRRLLSDIGVCAEFCGLYVDADGRPLRTPLTERTVGITAAQMLAIGEVIGIPYGVQKAPAVLAALRSGLVTSLVTHRSLALALLDTRRPLR